MKRTVIFISTMLATISLSSCQNKNATAQIVAENKTITVQDSMRTSNKMSLMGLNIEKSVINWKGSMLFSFGGHHGTINFKD